MDTARSLLRADLGEELPSNVERMIHFCVERGVGFILSRNIKSFSCRDARTNRVRLGHTGIPLYDEFKSIVLRGEDVGGREKMIAAHCRGHVSIDLDAIRNMLQLAEGPYILPEEELKARYDMVLGIVNPVLLVLNSQNQMVNIFDRGLLEPMTNCPGTMMTNAGDHTWGIEFDPVQLINAMENKVVADFACPDRELKPYEIPSCVNPKSIGIITGNGADSGIALWQRINRYFVQNLGEHFLGDISLPKVVVVSLPAMGLSMELGKRNAATWNTVSEAVNRLKEQDVALLALACHTTHYYTSGIRALFESDRREFVSMAEVTIDYLSKQQIDDIALLGISFVANLNEYSAYADLKHLKVEKVSAETLSKFHKFGYDIKKMTHSQAAFQQFVRLLHNEIHSENVVIALTELSILCEGLRKKHHSGKTIIDPLDLYAETIAKKSLGLL
jgi:aspartate/glutamate racemase